MGREGLYLGKPRRIELRRERWERPASATRQMSRSAWTTSEWERGPGAVSGRRAGAASNPEGWAAGSPEGWAGRVRHWCRVGRSSPEVSRPVFYKGCGRSAVCEAVGAATACGGKLSETATGYERPGSAPGDSVSGDSARRDSASGEKVWRWPPPSERSEDQGEASRAKRLWARARREGASKAWPQQPSLSSLGQQPAIRSPGQQPGSEGRSREPSVGGRGKGAEIRWFPRRADARCQAHPESGAPASGTRPPIARAGFLAPRATLVQAARRAPAKRVEEPGTG